MNIVHSYYNEIIISIYSSSSTTTTNDSCKSSAICVKPQQHQYCSSSSTTLIALLINTSTFNVPTISVNIGNETTTSQLYHLIDDYLNQYNIDNKSYIVYCHGKPIFKTTEVSICEHNIFPSQINEPYNITLKRGGIPGGKPGEVDVTKYLKLGSLVLYKKRYTKPPTQYQPGWKKKSSINNNNNNNSDKIIIEYRLGEIKNFDTTKLSF